LNSNTSVTLTLSNEEREIFSAENQQFVEAQAVKHETQLANEVRQLYCNITTLQRNQAIILAQTNGLLEGRSLNLGKCSRVSGSGRTLIVQQCATEFKFHGGERWLAFTPISRLFLEQQICILK